MIGFAILFLITASSFYSQANKVGASKIKWVIIGFFVVAIPYELIPFTILYVTKRGDLNPIGSMIGIIGVIMLSAIMKRFIKGPRTKI